jgi:hypothetical protein
VGAQRRLFDLPRGGRFTLLNLRAIIPADALPDDLKILNIGGQTVHRNDVMDSEGHLLRAYGATDRTLVLIRPDGYVSLISDYLAPFG